MNYAKPFRDSRFFWQKSWHRIMKRAGRVAWKRETKRAATEYGY